MADQPAAAAADAPGPAGERTLHDLVPLRRRRGGGEDDIIDWGLVVARARSHPEEAARLYENDELRLYDKPTVLHVMIKYRPPLEAVSTVAGAHPEAIDEPAHVPELRGSQLTTPLELALLIAPVPIVRALVRVYFEVRRRKDDLESTKWWTLLPWCSAALSPRTVRAFLEEFPSDTPLTYDAARGLLSLYIWRSYFLVSQKQQSWDILQLVLGFVTHRTVDPSVLNGHPHCYIQTILDTKSYRQEPEYKSFIEDTRLRDPSQFSARDSSGRLPLHALLSTLGDYRGEEEQSARLAAHDAIRVMLSEYREAARMPDPSTGELPLHVAVRLRLPYVDILGAEPRSARVQNPSTGELPLHTALGGTSSKDGCNVGALVRAEPRALRTRSGGDRLYPFELAMLRLAGSCGSEGEGESTVPCSLLNDAYLVLREEPSLIEVRAPLATRQGSAVRSDHPGSTAFVASVPGSLEDSPETKRRRNT